MIKKIEGIKEYFKGLTVTYDNIVLFVQFPDSWSLNLTDEFKESFRCEIHKKDNGVYFIDQFQNGTDEIFECVNLIISMNKEIEAKSKLLKEKAKELSDLFLYSSLEELQHLEFNLKQSENTQTKENTKKRSKKVNKKTENTPKETTNDIMTKEVVESVNTEQTFDQNSLLGSILTDNNNEIIQ